MAQRHGRGDLSAGLVALLDMIDRPAVVLAGDGTVLGANQRFQVFAAALGGAWPVRPANLLAPGSRERVERLAAGVTTGPDPMTLVFADGRQREFRAQRVETAPGRAVLLLVLAPDAAELPGLRAEASLRHDIAGPVTAILGTAELLLIRDREMSAEVRSGLDQIVENCGRISEILARSRHEREGNA
ncbi:MAG: hypothetical protein KBD01_12090 [Acidobacteria bacterium]|nr:hypothetical protein [Acidobacteriota bacterium]